MKKQIKSIKLYDDTKYETKMIFDAFMTLLLEYVTLVIGHKMHLCKNFSWIDFICLNAFCMHSLD